MAIDKQQARNDQRDSKRAFNWGVGAVILLVVLAVLGYVWISANRDEPVDKPGTTHETPANVPGTPTR